MKISASAVPSLGYSPLLMAVGIIALILTAAIIVLPLIIPPKAKKEAQGRHSEQKDASEWIEKVEDVKKAYEEGDLEEVDAYARLAQLARGFVSEEMDLNLYSKTLHDLEWAPVSNRRRYEMFRQTISALYPPEYADSQVDRAADEATVESAANWVEDLISRWNS
ncbi:MAG: hypothetical protein IIY17_02745 [Aeriscardovia sp.]|nr:hypothetical protein [Aeriscardovia sp.]MBQ1357544.1 hypothetical protein [Aeriscardovia sp.]MBQ1424697.1 hypothetical protein [Aeriscardovia sp.]MBQ5493209.1 hypothetical protein [Aeriscardovia sp.]MBQ5520642.1 hypothetical protein [Aeriscardovia sp.]